MLIRTFIVLLGLSKTSVCYETKNCGKQNISKSRIYGGVNTQLGEYPWMGLIFYSKRNITTCTGSLITKKVVITVAHCIEGDIVELYGNPTFVRLGDHDKSKEIDCNFGKTICAPKYVDILIRTLICHQEYDPKSRNQYNDIGLIILSEDVEYSDYIQPICLPLNDFDLPFGTYLSVSGWGKTPYASSSSIKLKAKIPLVNSSECNRVYASNKINLSDGQICAGGEKGFDSCRGDSGGPLMFEMDSIFILYGLVSFGTSACGSKGYPSMYTRVGYYLNWIAHPIQFDSRHLGDISIL